MFVCTTFLCEYIKSHRNDVNNLFDNTHVRIRIYRELHHARRSNTYLASERRHVILFIRLYIEDLCISLSLCVLLNLHIGHCS